MLGHRARPARAPGRPRRSVTSAPRLTVAALVILLMPALLVLVAIDYRHSAWGFAFIGFLLVGAIVLWRRPANTIGWLLFVVGASTALLVIDQWYVRSQWGPGPVAAEIAFLPLGSIPWVALILLIALFPDGRTTTRLQSFLVPLVALVGTVGLVGTVTNPDALTSGRPNPLAARWIAPAASWLIGGPGFLVVPAMLLVALVSLIVRWHRSDGERRLQFRWLIWGGGITLLALPGLFLYSGAAWSVIGVALLLAFWAIPVAIGIAVTRYRLYEIDRVISRTASYAIVTVMLVLTYAAIVTSVTRVIGSQSSAIVATATLVAAALFRPLLSRVQRGVDRRFNREKFDGQREVEAFGALLAYELHPDHALAELIAVTHRTLAPTTVSLWTVDGALAPAANRGNRQE
jgi:hypothetical protein